MTGLHDTSPERDANAREFHREQLSAMMDGTLSADETRFLLRRMQHDDELADCWGRWQFYGDALRGHAGRALPADFSQRVGRAIADDVTDDLAAIEAGAVSADARRPLLQRPLLRWGGGAALAASVALAAFLGGREPAAVPAAEAPQVLAIAKSAGGGPVPAPIPGPIPGPAPAPEVPAGGQTGAAAAVLVASAAAAVAEGRGGHPRIKAGSRAAAIERNRLARAAEAAQTRDAATTVVASQATQGGDLAPNAQIVAKPWPRALVPGASGDGTVTAGFDDGSDAVHPAFQPRSQPRFEFPPQRAEAAQASP